MPRSLESVIADLPPGERRAVERGAAKLVAEARTLADLRRDLNMTQATLAEVLETSQANVSKTEGKDDVMLSTARRIVQALGGQLAIYAELPGRRPIRLRFGAGHDPIERPKAGALPDPTQVRTRRGRRAAAAG